MNMDDLQDTWLLQRARAISHKGDCRSFDPAHSLPSHAVFQTSLELPHPLRSPYGQLLTRAFFLIG